MEEIARELNEKGVLTSRGKPFSVKAVSRILHNPLYTGRIVCRKSEVADYLTGRRRQLPQEEQFVTYRPELRLISDDLFELAQKRAQRPKTLRL